MSDDEKAETRAHIELYRQVQPLVHRGDLYRLQHPANSNWPALMYVAKDRASAVVFAFQQRAAPFVKAHRLRLRGLDVTARYEVVELSRTFGGDQLVGSGLELSFFGDWSSQLLRLRRV